MYKILLIDDNGTFLEMFEQMIDWNAYDMQVVGKYDNASAALEYIKLNRVDAIITDVCMPKMTGLDLAKEIYENYSGIKVVFFSAYREFEYAEAAIHYDVVGYINKPVSYAQLYEIMNKLKEKLDKQKTKHVSEIIDTKIIYERRELFCKWILDEKNNIDIKTEMGRLGILYRIEQTECALALISMQSTNAQFEKKYKFDKKSVSDAVIKVVCIDTADYYTILLDCKKDKIAVLYINKKNSKLPQNIVAVTVDDLNEIFGLRVMDVEYTLFDTIFQFKKDVNASSNSATGYIRETIYQQDTQSMIYMVRKYVDEHFAEDIDIVTVAKLCHFNHQYFGRLFKDITGEKFSDYLNYVRINKAKEILWGSDVGIDTLYIDVGFKNRSYFFRVFKDYTGVSPSQYRKQMLGENK